MFFLSFLRNKAGSSWPRTGLLTAIGIGFLVALAHVMFLDFPRGLLQDAGELPWPIGYGDRALSGEEARSACKSGYPRC